MESSGFVRRSSRIVVAAVLGLSAAGLVGVSFVASADPPPEGYPPDPPVAASTKHWVFRIEVKSGEVSMGPAHAVTTKSPEGTARNTGRWAIELWSGKELLDRIRFNVPGMGDNPHLNDKRILKRPRMDLITTHFDVSITDNPRTTTAKLVDRATGLETDIPWPPDAPPETSADAGSDAGRADAGAAVDAGGKADAAVDGGAKAPDGGKSASDADR